MQRLFIGGLGHTVTEKDLKDRFGKFGDVADVELRSRRDTEGVPYKTFGYININISDANLKRCLTVLNKSKWKGGTLRIEVAKEDFLQRLAEERQAAAEQRLKHSAAEDKKQKMLDSLREAGVENFTMRAAVPGTEVPGHKNWVVSKFGRVLPVLQLSRQKGVKVRPMKYDPSKYSHNIHRLDQSSTELSTPITHLTWELQGGDSDISKKRRGEFPPFHPVRPKRTCTDNANLTNNHHQDRATTRPDQSMADATDSVMEEVDEDDFEEVGSDYVLKSNHSCLQENDSDEEDEEDEESSSCSSDSDYEALFSNAPVMKISLGDLQKLSEESQQTTEAAPPSKEDSQLKAEQRVPKKGTTPEQILASLLEDLRKDELREKKMTKKTCVKMTLPPFRGTRALRGEEEEEKKEEEEAQGDRKEIQKLDSDAPQRTMDGTLSTQKDVGTEELAKSSEEDEEDDAPGALKAAPGKTEATGEASSSVGPPGHQTKASSTEEEEEEEEMEGEEEEEEEGEEEESEEEEEEEEESEDEEEESEEEDDEEESEEDEEEDQGKPSSFQLLIKPKEDEEQQRKDNQRRLAANQQRQKVTEQHKKLIQSALAKLDASKPGAGKHIVFDSDEEDHGKKTPGDSESEDEASAAGRDKVKPSVPQLFGDVDDEDSDKDDGTRFNIRPQFEGPKGQKLMELQSRFSTDERFRMDARFLEEDEDKEEKGDAETNEAVADGDESLEEERKKNLSILQSVLGSSQRSCSSAAAGKAKTFRDVAALHYDPTREEHAALETRTSETKESKSARRKRREEAEKIPEVSKEIYYDVSCDLKAAFGQKGGAAPEEEEEEEEGEEEEAATWDLHVEAEEEKLQESPEEESSGFQFSFFGEEVDAGGPEEEYKAESISAPKATRQPWQQDPQLEDSSSEDGEDEGEGEEEPTGAAAPSTGDAAAPRREMFFFARDDSRLTEGPRLFCCPPHLEEEKEQWEERRTTLRNEYRKKHKEARRKLRISKKS